MDSTSRPPAADLRQNTHRKPRTRETCVRKAVDLALFIPLTASIFIGLLIVDLIVIIRSAIRPLSLCAQGPQSELPAPAGVERRIEPAHLPERR